MLFRNVVNKIGVDKIVSALRTLSFLLIAGVFTGLAVGKFGVLAGFGLIGLPVGLLFVGWMFSTPQVGIVSSILIAFFATGIARYVDGPWGLMLDFALLIGWLSLLFQKFQHTDWSPLRHGLMTVTVVWFAYVVLEIVNPESNGLECWFYAMRTAGFYQLMSFGLVLMWWRKVRYLDFFLQLLAILSLAGALWGLKQQSFLDSAEYKWLYVDGNAQTHVLFGVLRVFSFYSDAGQFGGAQAMASLCCFLLATCGDMPKSQRIFYGVVAFFCFIGFSISGTRGAIAVFAGGGVMYLILSKNIKVLVLGGSVMVGAFVFLKYTKGLQNVEQVRRMRTSMNAEDPSMLVRYDNQRKFGVFLSTRPIGGGIGAAGFWGLRFGPGRLLAQIPTDSYYVRVWAETGIIGVCLHLFMFGYFMGRGGNIIWNLRDPVVKIKTTALYCSMAGVMLASYSNQVFSQQPTSILMGIAIPLIMMAPIFERELAERRKQQRIEAAEKP